MEIGGSDSYLVVARDRDDRQILRVQKNLTKVIETWGPSTRVSPVFEINKFHTLSPLEHDFKKRGTVLFLGPTHPEAPLSFCKRGTHAWLTLGLFNLVIAPKTQGEISEIRKWSKKNGVPIEEWVVENSIVRSTKWSERSELPLDWKKKLAKTSRVMASNELREAVHEYIPLAASTLSRTQQLPLALRGLVNLEGTQNVVDEALHDAKNNATIFDRYVALGQILPINAGLSRFSSQTFAGTSPITETECHFWSNSFLGIGIASLGLANLRAFLERSLGRASIPERFSLLRSITATADLTTLPCKDEYWFQDHLDTVKRPSEGFAPLVPLLSFFSGRDGYKSTLTTLSAPLAAISSCNCLQWSLLTLTHEVSHTIVHAALTEIIPDKHSSQEYSQALDLLDPDAKPKNLLEAIQRLLLYAILQMEQVNTNQKRPKIDVEILQRLVERWKYEVEEILVHAFDFLYFYGRSVDQYIQGIWASWGTIPNIGNRVREYVVRSISAALAADFRSAKAEEKAREKVRNALINVKNSGGTAGYIDEALKYIEDHWEDEILLQLVPRKELVKIARAFLFSSSAATLLRGDSNITGGAGKREGYPMKVNSLQLTDIENPLRFIELFTTSYQPSSSVSAWMFYVLAFGVKNNV